MNNPRILIVDDIRDNRTVLFTALSPYSNRINTAENGNDALDLFEQAISTDDSYDLVFLDIMMPGVDGREVLVRMRSLERKFKIEGPQESHIYMITADPDPEQALYSFMRGSCTEYIIKPVIIEDLIKKLIVTKRIVAKPRV